MKLRVQYDCFVDFITVFLVSASSLSVEPLWMNMSPEQRKIIESVLGITGV
jgi:hypothetical protein